LANAAYSLPGVISDFFFPLLLVVEVEGAGDDGRCRQRQRERRQRQKLGRKLAHASLLLTL
jgi:hypothetical protein